MIHLPNNNRNLKRNLKNFLFCALDCGNVRVYMYYHIRELAWGMKACWLEACHSILLGKKKMKQLEINFDKTESSISLPDLERFHWPDPDAIVKQLATDAGIADLFQDDQGPEPVSIEELNKLFSSLKG